MDAIIARSTLQLEAARRGGKGVIDGGGQAGIEVAQLGRARARRDDERQGGEQGWEGGS